MKAFLFQKIRLSWYFAIFLFVYFFLATILPKQTFEGGALTLFSVNSFLYGFYLAPILTYQKSRIEDLHKTVRSEANAIFSMMLHLKRLPDTLRNDLQDLIAHYVKTITRQKKAGQGEAEYEAIISYCLGYKGEHQDAIDQLLERLIANQQNRTQFSMLIASKVFSHEWMVILVLFLITIGFVLLLNGGSHIVFTFVTALLCTGLSMLLLILAKLSNLTHKRARQIWEPYDKLLKTHFYRID